MTDQQNHPITPPPKLVQQWWAQETYDPFGVAVSNLATQAARWGADQELEACISAILSHPGFEHPELFVEVLRAARRPKPPSLKEQALEALDEERAHMSLVNYKTICAVLESLPD